MLPPPLGHLLSFLKPREIHNPLAALAIRMQARYEELAQLVAEHFLPPPAPARQQLCLQFHLLHDPSIMEIEFRGALRTGKRKSAAGADGFIYQMLHNLDNVGFTTLLQHTTVSGRPGYYPPLTAGHSAAPPQARPGFRGCCCLLP